jgi:chaperone required for assembly of F1-ATPase
MRRFWTSADIVADGAAWHIVLDGKPVRLPGGPVLRVHHEKLALAMAGEWQATGAEMTFEDVPLTRLAGTLQERILPDSRPVIAAVATYGEVDLLCYRAEQPAALAQRQDRLWQPWLDWAAERLGAPLLTGTGISYVRQAPESLAALRKAVEVLPAAALAALGLVVPATGSLVLGLALAAGEVDAETVHGLALLEELFQAEFWGHDPEADARRDRIAADIKLAERFMRLCGGPQVRP